MGSTVAVSSIKSIQIVRNVNNSLMLRVEQLISEEMTLYMFWHKYATTHHAEMHPTNDQLHHELLLELEVVHQEEIQHGYDHAVRLYFRFDTLNCSVHNKLETLLMKQSRHGSYLTFQIQRQQIV